MWCHLCKLNFTDYEDFKCHVMEKHKTASDFYKDDSDNESFDITNDFEIDSDNGGNFEINDKKINNNEIEIANVNLDDIVDSEGAGESSKSPPIKNRKSRYSRRKRKSRRWTPKKKQLPKKYSRAKSSESDDSAKDTNGINENTEPASCSQYPTVNSLVGQTACFVSNEPGQGFTYATNLLSLNISLGSSSGFEMNSENLFIWYTKQKELCKDLKYPLPLSLFNKIKFAKHTIFDHYSRVSATEASSAILKVYEYLSGMIMKHITSVNEQLSLLRT